MIDYTTAFAIVVTCLAAAMLAFFCIGVRHLYRMIGGRSEKSFLCYPSNRVRFIKFSKRISEVGSDDFVSSLDKLSADDRRKFDQRMDAIRRKIKIQKDKR